MKPKPTQGVIVTVHALERFQLKFDDTMTWDEMSREMRQAYRISSEVPSSLFDRYRIYRRPGHEYRMARYRRYTGEEVLMILVILVMDHVKLLRTVWNVERKGKRRVRQP